MEVEGFSVDEQVSSQNKMLPLQRSNRQNFSRACLIVLWTHGSNRWTDKVILVLTHSQVSSASGHRQGCGLKIDMNAFGGRSAHDVIGRDFHDFISRC